MAAHGALAGPGQPFPRAENEAASQAPGRHHQQFLAGPVQGEPEMGKVTGYLLLRNTHKPGEFVGRAGLPTQQLP